MKGDQAWTLITVGLAFAAMCNVQSGTGSLRLNDLPLEEISPTRIFDQDAQLEFHETDSGAVSELFYRAGTISYQLGGKTYNTTERSRARSDRAPRTHEWLIQPRSSDQQLLAYSKSPGFETSTAVHLADAMLWVFRENDQSLHSAVVLAFAFPDEIVGRADTRPQDATVTIPPKTTARMELIFGRSANEVTVQLNDQSVIGSDGKIARIEKLKSGSSDPLSVVLRASVRLRGPNTPVQKVDIRSKALDPNHVLFVGNFGGERSAFAAALVLMPSNDDEDR